MSFSTFRLIFFFLLEDVVVKYKVVPTGANSIIIINSFSATEAMYRQSSLWIGRVPLKGLMILARALALVVRFPPPPPAPSMLVVRFAGQVACCMHTNFISESHR